MSFDEFTRRECSPWKTVRKDVREALLSGHPVMDVTARERLSAAVDQAVANARKLSIEAYALFGPSTRARHYAVLAVLCYTFDNDERQVRRRFDEWMDERDGIAGRIRWARDRVRAS